MKKYISEIALIFLSISSLIISILSYQFFNSKISIPTDNNSIRIFWSLDSLFMLGDEAFLAMLGLITTIFGFIYLIRQIRISWFDSKSEMLDRIHDYSERIIKANANYSKYGRKQDFEQVSSKIRFFIQLSNEFLKASNSSNSKEYTQIIKSEITLLLSVFKNKLLESPEGKRLAELYKKLNNY